MTSDDNDREEIEVNRKVKKEKYENTDNRDDGERKVPITHIFMKKIINNLKQNGKLGSHKKELLIQCQFQPEHSIQSHSLSSSH